LIHIVVEGVVLLLSLDESNKEIKEQIQKTVERGQLSNIEKENLERSLKDECEML